MPSVPTVADRVLFGAAYYAEYGHLDRIDADLDLMVAAGFNVIRVGESVWSTWEPDNGRFDLDWLQPVLDAAHQRGIAVVLGTPTYAAPPWLGRLYPEINAHSATGRPIGWGARQEIDYTHPAFRFHAERVIREVIGRYHDHPAVIGFQVDNEPGLYLLHNPGVFRRFVDELRETYGTVERLNEEWGLVYWSHRLSTWADLWTPDGNAQPQYDIAWRAFQARQTTEFIAWQVEIVREFAAPGQFVTTCIAYERPGIDDVQVAEELDITGANAYYEMQDKLAFPDARRDLQDWKTNGLWALQQSADRMWASRQAPFLVTETNASSIGQCWHNRPAYDGQWRQSAWALVSRGAAMVEYWQWTSLPYGAETYWGGVLPHSGEPNRVYREIAGIGADFVAAGDLVAGFTPDADVAMIYDIPSEWLMEDHPPLATDGDTPHPRAYHEIFDAFYKGAFDAGRQVRIVHGRQLLDGTPGENAPTAAELAQRHPVLVAAGVYLADDALLGLLRDYAHAGGHLILGPRTGYADELGRARAERGPARLAEDAGVSYDEFSNITGTLPVTADGMPAAAGTRAQHWVDGLTASGATVLAGYDHPHFRRWAAVTTRAVGRGRITVVGTVPAGDLAAAVMTWAVPGTGTSWTLPASVTHRSGVGAAGRRVHILHNWSWEPVTVEIPLPLVDVLGDEKHRSGDVVRLGAWDVRVLVE